MITLLIAAALLAQAPDPYAALHLYDGRWLVTTPGSVRTVSLENACARTGLYFVCEQRVDGKPVDLVVFTPLGPSAQGVTYRSQPLATDGSPQGDGSRLVIDGDQWTYSPAHPPQAGQAWERTVNRFFGPDRIRFEVQTSPDAKTWTTTSSGEEQRLSPDTDAPTSKR